MSTDTFSRLPEEKRRRILNAAWDEFTGYSFAAASINRIVHRAEIPRGSFYQYFDDKEDLFQYLTDLLRQEVSGLFEELLTETDGDLFRMILLAYDRLSAHPDDGSFPALDRMVSVIRLNPGIDLEKMMNGTPKPDLQERCLEGADLSLFRKQEKSYARRVCCLNGMCLGEALMNALHNPENRREYRQALVEELEIIRRGSLKPKALRERGALQ